MSGSTALYAPYRAIGYVTDGVPFIVNHLGDEIFLLFSIGKSFQVMNGLLLIPPYLIVPIGLQGRSFEFMFGIAAAAR